MSANVSKPYWDGKNCVSCATGTENAKPFLDGDQCVKNCSGKQFVDKYDPICVASCENGYILMDSYGILHKKCLYMGACIDEAGFDYYD